LIGKFNFYDIYGYFLPGLLLLTLLYVPWGLVHRFVPAGGELSSALIGIPLAYIVGQVVQAFALRAFPSTRKQGRYPSDMILDETDKTFSPSFKLNLAQRVEESFDLNVSSVEERADAFFLCRSSLIKRDGVSYGEQFEGMYALMRGLMAAFLIGGVYTVGYVVSVFTPPSRTIAVILLIAALGAVLGCEFTTDHVRTGRGPLIKCLSWVLFVLVFSSVGYLLGSMRELVTSDLSSGLLVIALADFVLARKCYQSYKAFAREFATAIYRDFYGVKQTERPKAIVT